MERDVEQTVIRPGRRDAPSGARDDHALDGVALDEEDTLLATSVRPPSSVASPPRARPEQGESPTTAQLRHYRFKVNSHEPIELDRPAHIGRRPSLSRVPQRVRPRLVRVPSPLQEVSATHLELRQEGASVVVTDLRSTNGTIVTVPGAVPRILRPGESLVVTPGTIVDLGDGNRIELLPLQLESGEPAAGRGAQQ